MDLFADVLFSRKAKKVDILIMWGFFTMQVICTQIISHLYGNKFPKQLFSNIKPLLIGHYKWKVVFLKLPEGVRILSLLKSQSELLLGQTPE